MIDYQNQAASRIIVTYGALEDLDDVKANPLLLQRVKSARFDPRFRGGPWYWDVSTNKHYYLPYSFRYKTQIVQKHVVEFVRASDFDFPRDVLGISFVDHGIEGQPMTGYHCKKYFRNCKERMTARDAKLRFYFTIYGRRPSNSGSLAFLIKNQENKICEDLEQLINDLKQNDSQTGVTSQHNRLQAEISWFVLSRALGEGNWEIARTFVEHLTKQELWALIREKFYLIP